MATYRDNPRELKVKKIVSFAIDEKDAAYVDQLVAQAIAEGKKTDRSKLLRSMFKARLGQIRAAETRQRNQVSEAA